MCGRIRPVVVIFPLPSKGEGLLSLVEDPPGVSSQWYGVLDSCGVAVMVGVSLTYQYTSKTVVAIFFFHWMYLFSSSFERCSPRLQYVALKVLCSNFLLYDAPFDPFLPEALYHCLFIYTNINNRHFVVFGFSFLRKNN